MCLGENMLLAGVAGVTVEKVNKVNKTLKKKHSQLRVDMKRKKYTYRPLEGASIGMVQQKLFNLADIAVKPVVLLDDGRYCRSFGVTTGVVGGGIVNFNLLSRDRDYLESLVKGAIITARAEIIVKENNRNKIYNIDLTPIMGNFNGSLGAVKVTSFFSSNDRSEGWKEIRNPQRQKGYILYKT